MAKVTRKAHTRADGTQVKAHLVEVSTGTGSIQTESDVTLVQDLVRVGGPDAPHTVESALAALKQLGETATEDQLATLASAGVAAAVREATAEIPALAAAASVVLEDVNYDGGAPYFAVREIRGADNNVIWTPPAKQFDEEDDSADAALADNVFPEFVPLLDRRMGRLRQEETDDLGNRSWRLQLGANTDLVNDEGRDAIYDALTADNSDAELSALEDIAGLLGIQYGGDAPREESRGHRRIQDALEGDSAAAVRDALVLVADAGNIDYTGFHAEDDEDDFDDDDEIED